MKSHRGFALLMAVIFMSVMLAFALTLGSLSYKQSILSSTATQSQVAFYVADAALECALLYDSDPNGSLFAFKAEGALPPSGMTCGGNSPISPTPRTVSHTATLWVTEYTFNLDNGTHCADVTVYKYNGPQPPSNIATYIFSQGYDVSCENRTSVSRFASRGLQVHH